MRHLTATAIGLALAAGTAAAQQVDTGDVISLTEWNYGDVAASGWSASALMDEDVYGQDGEEIGEVEDLIFGPDGRLISLVAEVGGFWDMGDTHVGVPWEQVEYAGTDGGVVVPVTEENVDDFDVFEYSGLPGSALEGEMVAGLDDAEIGGRAWRASELIGDYARLSGDEGPMNYGYVTDVIVQDGEVAATIVSARGVYGRGAYAYPPYAGYGYGWEPGSPFYDMPYGEADIEGYAPLEMEAETD